MRQSTKARHAAALQVDKIMRTNAALAEGSGPVRTWSATMPAYCFTELCADPGLRRGPGGKEEDDG